MELPAFRVPILGAPMAGATTPALAAAISNAGGLGSLACAYEPPERIAALIAETRALTDAPFAVNLFIEPPLPAADEERVRRAHERLRAYRHELGIAHAAEPPAPPDRYRAQIEAILAARPAVFSFTFGIPDAATVARFQAAAIATLGTATTVDEALALERAGIDAVVAQGSEAGGHRGTFLASVERSLIGTLALVPQVVDAVRVPVIAAGGIGDGRALAAVLALGARAGALGSALLRSPEATVAPAYRALLAEPAAHTTVITRVFSGRAARGVANRLVEELRDPEDLAPYPYQNAITRDVRNAGAARGRPEFQSLWAGQAVALARTEPAAAIAVRIAAEAERALERARAALN